ncbi:MAG TPA: putative molybdenum carrier protein, partial [Gemmataceae bacterium]
MKAPLTLRSGGQTGVDRAALDFALERGIPYGGWCPRGGRAEDIPEPPGLLARYPQLTETPSAQPEQRTAWNVRDSHATLILTCGNAASPGTEWTRTCAKSIFLKPCCVVDLADE